MDEESKALLKNILETSNTASLGTSENNMPYVSLISYSLKEDFSEIYMHISSLAKHSKNIDHNKHVSVLIYPSRQNESNPQTLPRISISGNAEKVSNDSQDYNEIKRNYLQKNQFAEMYFNLEDFSIYKINIEKARFVAGFGKTFNLTKNSLISLRK